MNLIIIGHPDKSSFCYNGILNTMTKRFEFWSQDYKVIDLYQDKFSPSRWYKNQNDVKKYQDLVLILVLEIWKKYLRILNQIIK